MGESLAGARSALSAWPPLSSVDTNTKGVARTVARPANDREPRMNAIRQALVWAMLLVPALAPAQGHAHQHGTLKLDIGVDANAVTLQIASPLDNLVGFEHAPRTDEQRKRVAAMLDRLAAAQQLFAIDPAAQCRLVRVDITSAVLGLGVPRATELEDQHADLEAALEFRCKDAANATYVDVHLFDAFAGTKRIDVRVAGPRGQFKRILRPLERRVALKG